jgi:hypothetical protein
MSITSAVVITFTMTANEEEDNMSQGSSVQCAQRQPLEDNWFNEGMCPLYTCNCEY